MASQPDVRLRLSAEGVQEVVNALKAVQDQAQKTAKNTNTATNSLVGGFDKLTKGLSTMKGALAAVAGATLVVSAAGLAGRIMEDAAALAKLSQVTGDSVENLSRLKYAAEQLGMPFDEMRDAFKDFNEKVGDAVGGSGDVAESFKAMGLSVLNSKGQIKSQSQLLDEIADKFATYKDGAAKSSLAIKMFGDAGIKLLPMLSQGSAGLRSMYQEADKFGATVSTKTAQEALEFEKSVKQVQGQLMAMVTSIAGPVLSNLAKLTTHFNEARKSGVGFWSSLKAAYTDVGFKDTVEEAQADIEKFLKLANENPGDEEYIGYLNLARKNLIALREAQKKPAEEEKKADAPGVGAADAAADTLSAKLAALKAESDMELAKVQANLALTSAGYDKAYKDQLISLKDYHAKRLDVLEQAHAAELAAATKALELAKQAPAKDENAKIARDLAIKQAQADLDRIKLTHQLAKAQADATFGDELKALGEQRKAHDNAQLTRTGQLRAAAIAALDEEIAKLGELLAMEGVVGSERERQLNELRRRGMGSIEFDESKRKADSAGSKFDLQKSEVQRDLSSGKLFPAEAEQRLLDIEKERVTTLEAIGKKMAEAAAATGNQELILQAQQFSSAVRDMQVATDEYGKAMATLKSGIQDSVTNGFNTMLDNIIDGTASAKDAVRGFASDVVNSIRKIAQEMLVQQMFKSLFGAIGGGAGGAGGGGFGGLFGSLMGAFATGGYVSGPGTGTSDSIPAWLSNGEFVVRASAVQSIGLDTLNEINRGRLPAPVRASSFGRVSKYADGGLVGSLAGATGGNTQVTLGLDDGLVLKKLSSPEGHRVLVEALGKNRRAVRQLIN